MGRRWLEVKRPQPVKLSRLCTSPGQSGKWVCWPCLGPEGTGQQTAQDLPHPGTKQGRGGCTLPEDMDGSVSGMASAPGPLTIKPTRVVIHLHWPSSWAPGSSVRSAMLPECPQGQRPHPLPGVSDVKKRGPAVERSGGRDEAGGSKRMALRRGRGDRGLAALGSPAHPCWETAPTPGGGPP